MPRWVDDAVNEYAKRFGRDIQYTLKEIKPEKRGAGINANQGMVAEEKTHYGKYSQQCVFSGVGRAWQSPYFGGIIGII